MVVMTNSDNGSKLTEALIKRRFGLWLAGITPSCRLISRPSRFRHKAPLHYWLVPPRRGRAREE